jgi:hypothetical protein
LFAGIVIVVANSEGGVARTSSAQPIKKEELMRRTVLLRMPRKRMMLALFVALLALTAAAVVAFAASLTKAPAASAQTTPPETEDPSFSVRCDFDHRNYDDPIVYPGKQGAAHRHDFYGNKTTNYLSTYSTLTAGTAGTTCLNPDDKSAYWTPTLWWNDSIVKASRAVFYYRADYKDPAETVQAYPPGLKVVPNTHVTWRCEGLDSYTYTTTPPKQCKYGLGVRIVLPDCLATDAQGNPLTDSTDPNKPNDHRSHMAYSTRNSNGYNYCPEDYPISVPELQMVIKYPIPTSKGTVKLSSGDATSMHADFFNAWNQQTLQGLVTDCINTLWPVGSKPAKCNQRSTTEVQAAQATLAAQEDQSQVKQQKPETSQALLKEEAALKQRD